MKKLFCPAKFVFGLAFIAIAICIFSFRQKDSTRSHSFRTPNKPKNEDTTPPGKRDRNAHEFRLDKLEEAMKNLELEMSNLEIQLKDLDVSKMEKEINASLSKINTDRIGKDVEAAIKKIDWQKMNSEINNQVKKLKAVNNEQIKASLDKGKVQLENQKLHFNSKKIQATVQKAMEQAKSSIEKSRSSFKEMEAFTNALEEDGLINRNKPYRIEVKDGILYLNGKRQEKEVSERYKKLYPKDNFSIIRNNHDDNDDII